MVNEKKYYTLFKQHLDDSLLNYFSYLNIEDWVDFFDDYYKHNITYLLRILETPKGEDIYSYGLIVLNDVDAATLNLVTKANDVLFKNYVTNKSWDLLPELLNTTRFLKLGISTSVLTDVVKDDALDNDIRELSAITLSVVHENTLIPFWDSLNLEKNKFLIPSFISFFERINPVKGLSKLTCLKESPKELESFETPILYSLHQISTSVADIEKYKALRKVLPSWAKKFIEELFEDYPELSDFKEKIQKPYEDILNKIGLNVDVLEDERLSFEMRISLETLLDKLKKKPALIKNTIQDKYTVLQPPYLKYIEHAIDELSTKIYTLNLGHYNDPPKEPVFDIPENTVYYDNPTIFLYPYFLDVDRIEKAGVIPYAHQISMAIIINKDNKLFSEWQELRNEIKNEYSSQSLSDKEADLLIDEAKSKVWLTSLINKIYAQNGQIHTIRGYVFHSIIKQFVQENIENDETLGEVLKAPTDLTFVSEKLAFFKNPKPGEVVNKNSILLLDPADALKETENGEIFMPQLQSQFFKVINVKHGLRIPVGIGFSLYALPRLLKDDNWVTLQKIMLDNLEKVRDKLYGVGISLISQKTKIQSTK